MEENSIRGDNIMITNVVTIEIAKKLCSRDYDVGAIVIRTDDNSPARYHGGTWQKIEGKFLLGSGGGTF